MTPTEFANKMRLEAQKYQALWNTVQKLEQSTCTCKPPQICHRCRLLARLKIGLEKLISQHC